MATQGGLVLPDYLRQPVEQIFSGGNHTVIKNDFGEATAIHTFEPRGWAAKTIERNPAGAVALTSVYFERDGDGYNSTKTTCEIGQGGMDSKAPGRSHKTAPLERVPGNPIQWLALEHLAGFSKHATLGDILLFQRATGNTNAYMRDIVMPQLRVNSHLFGPVVRHFLKQR